jgi:chromosome segregation ATPase
VIALKTILVAIAMMTMTITTAEAFDASGMEKCKSTKCLSRYIDEFNDHIDRLNAKIRAANDQLERLKADRDESEKIGEKLLRMRQRLEAEGS